MDGVLNLNKPKGCTSHDVVFKVRKITGEKKIGHTGTLDPDAAGVLVLCVGKATRIIEYLSDQPKSYTAVIKFGIETDTEDASGKVVKKSDCTCLSKEQVESAVSLFVGKIMQIPPMVSALHHQGKRLYELAREGIVVERQPREVTIHSLKLIDFAPGANASASIEVCCSKGTYIRTLCADIGKSLGCGAHMQQLTRTSAGEFDISNAITIDDISTFMAKNCIDDLLIPMNEALHFMPEIVLDDINAIKISNGVKLNINNVAELENQSHNMNIPLRICNNDKSIVAIGRFTLGDDGRTILKPEKVFINSPH